MTGLEAVRKRRLEDARRDAERLLTEAREEANRLRAAADADAQAMISSARHQGDAAANADTLRDWTSARRRARAIVLAAQKAAYRKLVDDAADAVRSDPRFTQLVRSVVDDAKRVLGPGARVTVGADEVAGSRNDREVRWTLNEAVEAALDSGAFDFEVLWR
jgi:vacuolar-type H+-ATPase subunit E/Vma4